MQQFWMVQGDGPSNFRHVSKVLAEAEAMRLARQNPGKEFYVMEAIVCHRKIDVERIELRESQSLGPDGLPF